MNDQVQDSIPHLKTGSSYLFNHKRKGPFVGEFKGTRPTGEGDREDSIFLEIDVYTEDGSGQERLANSFMRDELGRKMRPATTLKLIRPSLLLSVTTPSSEAQRQLLEQFTRIREDAQKRAEAEGREAILPSLSLPTKQVLSKIGYADERRSLWKKLLRRR